MDNETYDLYELSASKRKQLEKKHSEWMHYDFVKDYESLQEVLNFFEKKAKYLQKSLIEMFLLD